uniref:hypothetical protein n=1 Tax=Acinetobacter sp. LH3_13 TaxID=3434463 RepID=UPI003EB8F1C0
MSPTEPAAAAAASGARTDPIVVDLDGTLIRTDLLQESATLFLARNPLGILQVLLWLTAGRAALKARLAGHCSLD